MRIGGIYALERVARDSPKDHPTVMEVLAAFIRRHSREPWPPPAEPGAGPSTRPDIYAPPTRPDVYAAVTVIGRRTVRNDSQPINLFGAKIHGADLTSARLYGADLTDAILTNALWSSDMRAPPGWQRDTDSGRLKWAAKGSGDAAAEDVDDAGS